MKHTSGKWYFEQDGREPYVVCNNYALGRICTAEGVSHEARANMHLISAAPELQRALLSLMIELKALGITDIEETDKLRRILNCAEQALRKSRGLKDSE
jgi:hypothetical protein